MTSKTSARFPRWLQILLLLFIVAIVIFAAIAKRNLGDPLTREQLDAARKLWKDKRPADYTLTYTIRRNNDPKADRYVVKVRNHKAVAATVNDLNDTDDRLGYYGMEKLFDYIEGFQRLDADKKTQSPFVRATFDEQTGALRWYVRRVLGDVQGVEIRVERVGAE